jgi:hypothetical protein
MDTCEPSWQRRDGCIEREYAQLNCWEPNEIVSLDEEQSHCMQHTKAKIRGLIWVNHHKYWRR